MTPIDILNAAKKARSILIFHDCGKTSCKDIRWAGGTLYALPLAVVPARRLSNCPAATNGVHTFITEKFMDYPEHMRPVLLLHELTHVTNMHTERAKEFRKTVPQYILNMCADFAINSPLEVMCQDHGFEIPTDILVPGRRQWEQMPMNKSFEHYIDIMLKSRPPEPEDEPEGDEGGDPGKEPKKRKPKDGESEDDESQETQTTTPQPKTPDQSQPPGKTDPKANPINPDIQPEDILEKEIDRPKVDLDKIQRQAPKTLQEYKPPRIEIITNNHAPRPANDWYNQVKAHDWTEFNKRLGEFASSHQQTMTWNRPDRHLRPQGIYAPSPAFDTPDVVALVDTSGSMNVEIVAKCMDTINLLRSTYNMRIHILRHDDAPILPWFSREPGETLPNIQCTFGGTSHISALCEIEKEFQAGMLAPSTVVIALTDCDSYYPDNPISVPILWAKYGLCGRYTQLPAWANNEDVFVLG